jgi:putative addiction module CopG family antidote
MRATRSLSITLPVEIADMVEAKVASGEYASESDVIAEGLRPMAAHDAAIERWLRDEVVPTLREMDAHPERGLTGDEVDRYLDELAAKLTEQMTKE